MSDKNFKVTSDEKHGKIASGTLKHGLKIGGELEKDFIMREAIAGDMFAAEDQVSMDKPLSFNAAMMAAQLIKMGSLDGVDFYDIKSAKPEDFAILRNAQEALEIEGEPEKHGNQSI